MNFISSLLGRHRDDGASTEPLTTAELLGLRDAALRVGRRWLERCDDDGAVRTLAGPCGRDALEAACAAASHRGTTDDDAIALGARRALESMVLTDDSSEAAPGDVEDLATLACVVRLFVDDDEGAAALVRTLADACDSRRLPAAGRAVAEAVAVAYSDVAAVVGAAPLAFAMETLTPGLLCDALAGTLPLDALVVVWDHVFAAGEVGLLRALVACVGVARETLVAAARRRQKGDNTSALAHDVVSDLCRDADAGALAREIERLSRREDVSALLGDDLRHAVGTAATLTRAELRRRLLSYDVDGDGVLEASEALDAARALGGDDEDTSLVARAAVLAARSGSVTVAALERAALGDDSIARCLGGAVDPAGGSTAAPSSRAPSPTTPASPAMPPPPVDAPPACFSCVFAKSA
ncbi:unnamed protein product [Pelagomonas calceolata]|uniref:EF-hand domain-containing protein n=1 Tax=Pelagomonas calceolata TaxID=35677 RepID=A0A8J2T106_9STRA|nr:unnamed protein product [Pelagomonas calceolata]